MIDSYCVEVCHWTRSHDGDDWILGFYKKSFNTLDESRGYIESLRAKKDKDLIEAFIWGCERQQCKEKIEVHDFN
jgi:hypothetical protein